MTDCSCSESKELSYSYFFKQNLTLIGRVIKGSSLLWILLQIQTNCFKLFKCKELKPTNRPKIPPKIISTVVLRMQHHLTP